MDITRDEIQAMAAHALFGWADRTEPLMFPIIPKDQETPVAMVLCATLNAIAYGLEKGAELGCHLAT